MAEDLADQIIRIADAVQRNYEKINAFEERMAKIESLLEGAKWQKAEGDYVLPDFANTNKTEGD